jgi:hypothetical protein
MKNEITERAITNMTEEPRKNESLIPKDEYNSKSFSKSSLRNPVSETE